MRDDTFERYAFGGTYAYGPGMELRASVHIHNLDGPDNSNSPTNDRNDSIFFVIGTVVNF